MAIVDMGSRQRDGPARDGLVLQLPQSKASPDHSVWVPIANQPDSDWNPTARLEDWLEAAAQLRPTATEAVWLHVTRGDTVTRDAPITAAAINIPNDALQPDPAPPTSWYATEAATWRSTSSTIALSTPATLSC